MKISTQRLAISALLLTADILLTRVLALNTFVMKIGFGFTAVAICAMLYGPMWTALVAALGDLLGSLIFPTGAYFPGFTLTAAVTGLIFGFCLYKRGHAWLPPVAAAVLNTLLVSFLANSAMIAYLAGTTYTAQLAVRAVQFVIMVQVQAVTLFVLSRSKFVEKQILSHRE